MKIGFRAPVIDTRSEIITLRLMPRQKLIAPAPVIEKNIHLVRGQKVMLDSDLAELYQVPTKQLNRAVSVIASASLKILRLFLQIKRLSL